MRWVPWLLTGVRNMFRRSRLEDEARDELAFHLETRAKDLAGRGIPADAAARQARIEIGGTENYLDRLREAQGFPLLDALARDIRYGTRQLLRTPAFTIVAVLSLGIGAGATITIFGFASALFFKPLPARNTGDLVRVMGEGGSTTLALSTFSDAHIPAQDFFRYRDGAQTFVSLAAHFIGGPTRVRVDGPARMIPVMLVSANYFDTLGVGAALGRPLMPQDGKPGAPAAVVLSDIGWRRFFDADPAIVGRPAFVDGRPATIVGVLPASFTGTFAPMVPQIYAPMIERPATIYPVDLIGRLKPGVSAPQARADLSRIAAQLTASDGRRRVIETYPPTNLQPVARWGLALIAAMFVVIVAVVLLIACDNIAILLLTRSARRRQEIGLRLALGASRGRLLMQMLIESLLLCGCGGLVGLFIANATARFMTQFYVPVPMPFALSYDLDWRVVVFALAVSCLTTVLCGLAPALQSLKTDVMRSLKASALIDGSRVRSSLIVTQTTLSTALLVTAVVLTRSLMTPITAGRGFESRGVLMTTVAIDDTYSPERRALFFRSLTESLERAGGVSAVTAVDNIPTANSHPAAWTEMRSSERVVRVSSNHIAPDFFRTLGIPLLAGRDFTSRDDAKSGAVGIVNETLASRLWPGLSAVGQRLQAPDGSFIEVVGLARESKDEAVDEAPTPFLYRPMAQGSIAAPTFLIGTTGDPAATLSLVRARIAEFDPDLAPYNVMALDDRLSLGVIANRAAAVVSGSMGLVALVLSAMGIYGTMSFLVQQRRREIGVRIALGASRRNVVSLITRQAMTWTAAGLAIGLAGGLAAALLLGALLRGVTPNDPMAFVLTTLVLGGAAYLACYVPARRATRVDPLTALRED